MRALAGLADIGYDLLTGSMHYFEIVAMPYGRIDRLDVENIECLRPSLPCGWTGRRTLDGK